MNHQKKMEAGKGVTPADVLGEEQNYLTTETGVKLRKGSVAAAIANAKVLISNVPVKLEGPNWEELKKLSQSVLKPLGFYEVLRWKHIDLHYALTADKEVPVERQQALQYRPTLTPSKEDVPVWNAIVKQLKNLPGRSPDDPELMKMLKLLEVHSYWFRE